MEVRGRQANHQPASFYGEEAAYCYAKAHYMGNYEFGDKEAWHEIDRLAGRGYGAQADIRIQREEEEEGADAPPAR